jgi:hypothetical protein
VDESLLILSSMHTYYYFDVNLGRT